MIKFFSHRNLFVTFSF
uniref:Uncharacterized protein n=1 Tax=Rhizophora mucronata TaxID=61149 RepID=A0A2P2PV98_RHIMU